MRTSNEILTQVFYKGQQTDALSLYKIAHLSYSMTLNPNKNS